MNLLSVTDDLVIVDENQNELIKTLLRYGIESIPMSMRHQRTLGGGFHCVTLDLKEDNFFRDSSVFSNQVKLHIQLCHMSHCLTNKVIKNNYELYEWVYVHEDEDLIFEKIKKSDIIGVSNFVWNENINNSLCNRIKNYNKNVKIIYGGLGTPNDAKKFLKKYPFIDAIVNGEGEYAFEQILIDDLNDDLKKSTRRKEYQT